MAELQSQGGAPLMQPAFAIGACHDVKNLADIFAATGRLRIHNFLADDGAERLHANLAGREDWYQLIGGEDKVFEIDRPTRSHFTPYRLAALDEAVHAAARDGFQFRFESVRVPDDSDARVAMADPLGAFAQWLSGEDALQILREITGEEQISFADAQATSYSAGDFLTAHDDAVAGKHRRAAYVLGLTPRWRIEWGGLLAYHDGDEAIAGLAPGFNTLDLFRVPRPHSVSLVAPSAGATRLSITGWLRDLSQTKEI